LKQRLFDKVDEKAFTFPEEQRQRRIAELKLRLEDLLRRKEEAIASFEQTIAVSKRNWTLWIGLDPSFQFNPCPNPCQTCGHHERNA
jgi:hypothetical protein